MKFFKKAMLFVVSAVFLFSSVACDGKGNAQGDNDITMKSLYNTLTVERSADISGYSDAVFAVEAAKGETDGAQIVINPESRISSYTASVSDLTGAGGTIAAENLTLYVEIYARVVDGTADFPAGYYPDALIPIEYIVQAGENSVEAGQNQAFWLDVAVPSGTAAGSYTGQVVFNFDGEQQAVAVTLTVFDFEMPAVSYMNTSYLIWRNWVIQGELDNTVEMWETYFDFLLDYNFVGYDLPAEPGDIDGFKAALRKYYDRVPNYFIPFQLAGNFVLDYDFAYDYLYAIAEISLEDGVNYFDKAKYYIHTIYDECNHDSVADVRYPATKTVLETMDQTEQQVVNDLVAQGKLTADSEIAQGLCNVQHVMTTTYIEELAEDYGVDLFCPGYGVFNTTDGIEYYQELMEQGVDIYSYGAMTRGLSGSVLINDYTISGRDIMWSKYAYGVTGELYWNVTGYMAWWQFVGLGYGLINDLYTQASHDGLSNGDGYLLYPGALYGSDQPFPSIRLTVRRDGVDDYDYMSLLQEEYDQLAQTYGLSGIDANQVLQPAFDSVFSLSTSKLNYSGLASSRRSIANLIELAQSDAAFAVNEFDCGTDAINYSFLVKEGATVTVDGTVLAGGLPVSGGVRYTSMALYPADGVLTITVEYEGKTYSVDLNVGAAPELMNGFEEEADLEGMLASTHGSGVAINTNSAYALEGNSLEVTLHGWSGVSAGSVFYPFVYIPVSGLSGTAFLEFQVYNPGESITVNIEAVNNTTGITYVLDTVTLDSGKWTTVRVGNFNVISTDASALDNITAIGIVATENLLDGSGNEYAQTLYVDEFYKTAEVAA